MNFKNILSAVALSLLLASCSSPKTALPYFSDLTSTSGDLPAMPYLSTIEPDDELVITVQSTDARATAQYNMPFSNIATPSLSGVSSNPSIMGYRVDTAGDIIFPVLGKIHVAGLTVEELQKLLTDRISKDVADPIVTVAMRDFTVVVAGEVTTPQPVQATGNRMTVLEALAAAGDLTEFGERSNVLVIREENGKRTFQRLDLNSSETLSSPYYYLRPNDYVYVSPNSIRQDNSKYNQNNAYKLSVTSTIVSAASVIASLVIALTVK